MSARQPCEGPNTGLAGEAVCFQLRGTGARIQRQGYPGAAVSMAGTRCARRRPVAVIRLAAKLCQTPTAGLTAQQTTSTEQEASVTSSQCPERPAERHDAVTARRSGCQCGRSRRRSVNGAERCDGPGRAGAASSKRGSGRLGKKTRVRRFPMQSDNQRRHRYPTPSLPSPPQAHRRKKEGNSDVQGSPAR